MSELGLVFSAVDLIRIRSGEHVFLEVNPSGEFFWLERTHGLPISHDLADLLPGDSARRKPAASTGGVAKIDLK